MERERSIGQVERNREFEAGRAENLGIKLGR